MNRILSLIGVVLVVGCGSPPPDGPYEDYHDNGQLFQKGTYKDGKPDGPSEYYYDNGQLESKGTLKDNEKCGEWLEQGETVTHDPC
jgi:antitoxin component YwqK of YwqJK toxin-antitoxin module